MDSDATYCTEIETAKTAQTLHEILVGESASQPVISESKRYNLRNTPKILSQDETQMRAREREKTIAAMRLRLRQIQARLRKPDVSLTFAESQALEQELKEMSETIGHPKTTTAINGTITKLQAIRTKEAEMDVPPEKASWTMKGGRGLKKPLKSKLQSPRVPKKKTKKPPKIAPKEDSHSESLNHTGISDTYNHCNKFLNKSINLFKKDKADAYSSALNENLLRLQEVMARTKETMDQMKREREEASRKKLMEKAKPKRPSPVDLAFDPYLAPYTEDLFSDPIVPEPKVVSKPIEPPSTYSWFNDTDIPLGQKVPSAMEYDHVMQTSFLPNKSDIASRDLFDSTEENHKSVSFAFKLEEEKSLFEAKVFPAGAQQSFEINSSLMSNMESNQSIGQYFQQSLLLSPPGSMKRDVDGQVIQPQMPQVVPKSAVAADRMFSPVHLHLLAERLHLNEFFLKYVINDTYQKAIMVQRQQAPPEPQPLLPMDTDDMESHVSNTPVKQLRPPRNARAITDDIFNVPIFEQF